MNTPTTLFTVKATCPNAPSKTRALKVPIRFTMLPRALEKDFMPCVPQKGKRKLTDEEQTEHVKCLNASLYSTIAFNNALSYEGQFFDFQAIQDKKRRVTL
jgi:hypothetical protein